MVEHSSFVERSTVELDESGVVKIALIWDGEMLKVGDGGESGEDRNGVLLRLLREDLDLGKGDERRGVDVLADASDVEDSERGGGEGEEVNMGTSRES